MVCEQWWGMRLRRDKYLPRSGLIPCFLCIKYYILIVMGGLLAKKKMESWSLNVICITITMENKEILMLRAPLRAEWSLPSGNPLHTGRAEHWNHASHVALSSLWSEQKAAVTVVSPGLFRKKCDIFPVSRCCFPLAPTQLGCHRANTKSSLCNSVHGSSSCSRSHVGRLEHPFCTVRGRLCPRAE